MENLLCNMKQNLMTQHKGTLNLTLRFSCWMKISIQYENIHYRLDQHTTTSHVLQSKSGNASKIISYSQICRIMKKLLPN